MWNRSNCGWRASSGSTTGLGGPEVPAADAAANRCAGRSPGCSRRRGRPPFAAAPYFSPSSFQADDELRRMRAPIDRNDVGARVRGADLVRIVSDDGWDRNHEILAEIAARIAGNGVRHFADQILDVLIAG